MREIAPMQIHNDVGTEPLSADRITAGGNGHVETILDTGAIPLNTCGVDWRTV